MKFSLLVCLVILSACASTPKFQLDPNKVVPWSDELGEKEPFQVPFITQFYNPEHELFYIASHHGNKVDSPTFRLVKKALDDERITHVLIEGVPSEKGKNPSSYLDYAKRTCDKRGCEGGESAYAAYLAAQKGIPVEGVEPSDKVILKNAVTKGFLSQDLIAFYFLRQIPQWRRQEKLSEAAMPQLMADMLAGLKKSLSLPANYKFSYADLQQWYQKRNKKPFVLEQITTSETAPYAKGQLFTQQLSAAVGEVRDQEVIRLLNARITETPRLLIVMGSSHLATQRPAIQSELHQAVERIGK